MTVYSYAQLEGLWIEAGGPRALAPVAAAIAEAESGGNSDARNPSGASGLWQILGNPFPGNPFDPATNARMAVAKWRGAPGGGNNFSPWVTYEDGAYKAYLSNSTTPAGNVPGSPTGVSAQVTASGDPNCAWNISLPSVGALGVSVGLGNLCIVSKTQARAAYGGMLVAGGSFLMLVGLGLVVTIGEGPRLLRAVVAPVLSTAKPYMDAMTGNRTPTTASAPGEPLTSDEISQANRNRATLERQRAQAAAPPQDDGTFYQGTVEQRRRRNIGTDPTAPEAVRRRRAARTVVQQRRQRARRT